MDHDPDHAEAAADLLAEQIAYYRARAPEYDDWFERRGRHDRGPEHTARWNRDIERVRDEVHAAGLRGDVLELACGTGWWTAELARSASGVLAVDASPEALELNRHRVGARNVRYLEADLFAYPPLGDFDAVFFSFWLSHVPPEHFERFWEWVAGCLRPEGRVFFIDNLPYPETRGERAPYAAERELADGRRFEIVKVFHEPEELPRRLAELGWTATVGATPEFFLWGEARRREGGAHGARNA